MQQVIPNYADAFATLHDAMSRLFSLPSCMGGLEERDPVEYKQLIYSASKEGTTKITSGIKGMEEFSVQDHCEEFVNSHAKLHTERS